MKKIQFFICLSLLLALLPAARGQNGINMPYSQFGVGLSNRPYNMPFASMAGGTAIAAWGNNFINPFNPASYAAVQRNSFVFDMGMLVDMNRISTPTGSFFDADANIGYLAFAFPLCKWWKTSFGLMPYSDVNYEAVVMDEADAVKTRYEGTGAVNQFFWGHAFNIIGSPQTDKPALMAGFNINYLMGSVVRGITYDFQGDDSTYCIDSRREKTTRVSNFTFDLGLQYGQPLKKGYRLAAGVVCKTPHAMQVRDVASVYTFVSHSGTEYMRDTIFPTSGSNEYRSTLAQPLALGVGLSLQRDNHWRLNLDMEWAEWHGLKYTENLDYNIFGQSALQYDSYSRYALGAQWLGDKGASKYFRRISFSTGVHYEQGMMYLSIDDKPVNQAGIGCGASLPMRKGRSALNIALGYNRYGSSDLLANSCFTVSLSIASCESWFVIRKYD